MRPIAALLLLSVIACADPAAERLGTEDAREVYPERTETAYDRGSVIEVDPIQVQSLADLLIRAPGVMVHGGGAYARVRIRGAAPLYVVDGIPIGYSYTEANSLVVPQDVASVEVLNGPEATALYGRAGGNGVIAIRTR